MRAVKLLIFFNLIVLGINNIASIINIVSLLRIYKFKDEIEKTEECSGYSSENSPKQRTFVPLFILSLFNIVVFAVLCTLGGVTIFSE